MGDMILALICIISILGALWAFGLAFRHHWHLIAHELLAPPEGDKPE